MKKLIAISVVFALVAGAAFAADVGVDVYGRIDLVSSDGEKDADLRAGGEWGRTQINASGENEDGTFGGWFRFRADGYGNGNSLPHSWGNVWWKPISQVKFMIGGTNDSLFGADGVTRWGFYQVAGDIGIVTPHNAWWAGGSPEGIAAGGDAGGFTFSSAFYGGWDSSGAIITITPIDALAINIAVPFIAISTGGDSAGPRGADVYKRTAAQVAVNLDGIGKLAFTWDKYGSDGYLGANLGTLFTYFNLTAVENLSVDLGIGLPFIQGADKTSYFKMAVGLGVTYNISSFGVKARFVTQFGGATYDGKTNPYAVPIIFDIMPYYAITDKVTVNLSFGMGALGEDKDQDGNKENDASEIGWHLYPYVTIKAGWWAPNFYAGIKVEADGSKNSDGDAKVTFSVPIGIAFSF